MKVFHFKIMLSVTESIILKWKTFINQNIFFILPT